LNRDNDLPVIECVNGEKFFYKNGQLYRDFSAIEDSNT
jgi:hypothetical protein